MCFDELESLLQKTAEAFRLGAEAQGSEGLVALIDGLPALLEQVPGDATACLNQVLSAMLAAQSRKDYLYLADLLEYELPAILAPCPRQ